jgi:hypothetical protein
MGVDHEVEGFVLLLAAREELLREAMILRRTAPRAEFRAVVDIVPLARRIGGGVTDLAENAGEIPRLLEGAKHRRERLGKFVKTKQPAVMPIASRGDDAAARTTNGVVDEAVLKAEALGSELAKVRRDSRRFAIQEVHRLIAEVIGSDEQDIERRPAW